MVNTKKTKMESFSPFCLFLSLSALTPNPGRLWDVTWLVRLDTTCFFFKYPASHYFAIFRKKVTFTKKYVQFQLYQWQAFGTEQTSKQKVTPPITFFLLTFSRKRSRERNSEEREKQNQRGTLQPTNREERSLYRHVDSQCCYYYILLYHSCRIPKV